MVSAIPAPSRCIFTLCWHRRSSNLCRRAQPTWCDGGFGCKQAAAEVAEPEKGTAGSQEKGSDAMTGERGLSKGGVDHLRGVMAGHVERGDLPGLVMLVSRNGEAQV